MTDDEIKKIVGPGTFTRDSYSVTIAEDGKILVKEGDWLSKYSWALYGEYDMYEMDVFVRGNPKIKSPFDEIKGYKLITEDGGDYDRIDTGEYLIHRPTYEHWLRKRGKPIEKKPEPVKPIKPGHIPSTRWMAANLGDLEFAYFGAVGATMLVFRNLDIGKDFCHVLLRAGLGGEFGLGNIGDGYKLLKNAIRGAGWAIWGIKMVTANFVPVVTHRAFSAKSVEYTDVGCLSWTINTGGAGGLNRSYEQIRGSIHGADFFNVTFIQNSWIEIPNVSGSVTAGKILWIW